MIAIIGAILMLVVITISILLLCGLPLGELTMGGSYNQKLWIGKNSLR